jgi:hypothetical protein
MAGIHAFSLREGLARRKAIVKVMSRLWGFGMKWERA